MIYGDFKMKKYFFAVSILILSAAILFTITDDVVSANYSSSYEVNPQINIPLRKSQQTQVAEVFERIMLRYQELLEKSMLSQKNEISDIAQRLDRIEAKIDHISMMLEKTQERTSDKTVKPVTTPTKASQAK